MNLVERQKQFVDAVKKQFGATKKTKISTLFGVSNSAKIIEGGIQLGVPNLDNATADNDSFIFTCVLKFPPEDEVYFAVLIRSAKTECLTRLADMKALGAAAKTAAATPAANINTDDDSDDENADDNGAVASIKYSAKNNLAVAYIAAANGKVYLRNAGFWSTLKMDMAAFAPAIEVDAIAVAMYPPSVSVQRSLLARDFIGYLGDLIGREKIHELRVWSDGASVSPTMRRMPHKLAVSEIEAAIQAAGRHYPGGEVRRFHAGLNFLRDKHFVILSGLSGSGKTQLALRYARAVHGLHDANTPDPFLFVCAVRPEWTDPTGLTGYYDVLSNRYVVPPFLEAVLLATAHPDLPVFVVLDEMNLARVEYYFSDVLSALETGEALQLHSNSVPLEGTTGTSIRAELSLPPNLYITGTINVDETTNPVSDKVLDRAVVIDMSVVDLPGFLAGLETRYPDLKDARAACETHLLAAHDQMTAHSLGFGYRVAEEAVRYHAFTAQHLGATPTSTTDDLMVQKILVKLRGTEKQRKMLTGLQKTLEGLPRSQTFISKLIADLDEFGSFQASR